MRTDVKIGAQLPDYELADHTGQSWTGIFTPEDSGGMGPRREGAVLSLSSGGDMTPVASRHVAKQREQYSSDARTRR